METLKQNIEQGVKHLIQNLKRLRELEVDWYELTNVNQEAQKKFEKAGIKSKYLATEQFKKANLDDEQAIKAVVDSLLNLFIDNVMDKQVPVRTVAGVIESHLDVPSVFVYTRILLNKKLEGVGKVVTTKVVANNEQQDEVKDLQVPMLEFTNPLLIHYPITVSNLGKASKTMQPSNAEVSAIYKFAEDRDLFEPTSENVTEFDKALASDNRLKKRKKLSKDLTVHYKDEVGTVTKCFNKALDMDLWERQVYESSQLKATVENYEVVAKHGSKFKQIYTSNSNTINGIDKTLSLAKEEYVKELKQRAEWSQLPSNTVIKLD